MNHYNVASWCTDLHWEQALEKYKQQTINEIKDSQPDCLLISGDIADAAHINETLLELQNQLQIPIYFILGNHDYYGSRIETVRTQMQQLCKTQENLHYLSQKTKAIQMNHNTCLIGHDGWADSLEGDFLNSSIRLRDYEEIHNLNTLEYPQLPQILTELGKESASFLQQQLANIPEQYSSIIVLTHVPPFRQACLYKNQAADDNWAPHFVCQSIGNTLKNFCSSNPHKQVVVMCGHSHHKAHHQELPNLEIFVGEATTQKPKPQQNINIQQLTKTTFE